MIRFSTPGLIGEMELLAMQQATAYCRRSRTLELTPELAKELRILGIAVEKPWPEPTGGGVSIPHHGTVA